MPVIATLEQFSAFIFVLHDKPHAFGLAHPSIVMVILLLVASLSFCLFGLFFQMAVQRFSLLLDSLEVRSTLFFHSAHQRRVRMLEPLCISVVSLVPPNPKHG